MLGEVYLAARSQSLLLSLTTPRLRYHDRYQTFTISIHNFATKHHTASITMAMGEFVPTYSL